MTAPLASTSASVRAPLPWRQVGDNHIRLLRDGAEAFPAMIEAIKRAKREVLLEMYWVGDDLVGARFRDVLTDAARRGVAVRVVYDALGSIGISPAFWDPLVMAGGKVHAFHGVLQLQKPGGLERLERRDHRKVLIVDAQTGFTGGLNLSLPWLPVDLGGEGWRDDVIEAQGAVTSELRALFFRTWHHVSGEGPPRDVRPVARPRLSVGPGLHPVNRARVRPVWVLATHWRTRRGVHREYLVRIRNARHRIDIANSYFVPDRHVLRALLKAARRGVRIRVLVPEKSDVTIVQFAVEASFEVLLRRGIEIYALPGRMLHSKTAVIDERFTTIGSYNLDHRSWRKNLELNVAVEDRAFALDVTAAFEDDLAFARRVDLHTWRARPTVRRGIEWIARRFRKLW